MNAVYKSIWNESLGAWVATAENTAARGKKSKARLALTALAVVSALATVPAAWAAPCTIVSGGVDIYNCSDAVSSGVNASGSTPATFNFTNPASVMTNTNGTVIYLNGSTTTGVVLNTLAGQQITANTAEGNAYGIQIFGIAPVVNNAANIVVEKRTGDTGQARDGIYVEHNPGFSGSAAVVNNSGSITTNATSGYAGIRMVANNYPSGNPAAKLTINHNAGTITTTGQSTHGLMMENGYGSGTYNFTSSGNIITSGTSASGIYTQVQGGADCPGTPGTINVTVGGGSISAKGLNGSGIKTSARSCSNVTNSGGIVTIKVNAGTVFGGTGPLAAGISVDNGNSIISIASGARVGADSDIAINTSYLFNLAPGAVPSLTASYNKDSTTINNSGTITGTIYTGYGGTGIVNETTGVWNLRNWSSNTVGGAKTVNDVNVVLGRPKTGTNLNNITNNGLIQLTQISGHNAAQNATFSGLSTFNNNATGTLSMVNGFAGDKITINGNYNAQTGAKVNMDVVLNGDTSASDKLVINGSATGATKVYVTNVGGTGGQTVNGISLIEINPADIRLAPESALIKAQTSGPITAQAIATPATFTLGAPVQAGNYEYFLNAKGTGYALESTYSATPAPAPAPAPAPSAAPTPTPNPTPTPVAAATPAPAPQVLRPGVVAYSLASQTNFELNQVANGTYNDRIGAQTAAGANNGWVRVGASNVDLSGAKSFDIKQKHSFVQGGKDLLKSTDSGTSTTTGVAASYSNSDNTLYNRDRLKGGFDSKTGSLKSTQMTLAAYHTRQLDDGSIIDIVGALSSLENKFSDVNGTGGKQTGTGVALSVEFAKPIAIMNGSMTLEPQAQLSFQNHSYKAFNDSVATIDAYSADSLRARVGMRLSMGDKTKPAAATEANSFYFSANLLQDLIAPEGVTIGGGTIQDDVNKKTWLEVGVGGQAKVGANATVYGSVNYQKSISGSSRSGAAGNVGVKVAF